MTEVSKVCEKLTAFAVTILSLMPTGRLKMTSKKIFMRHLGFLAQEPRIKVSGQVACLRSAFLQMGKGCIYQTVPLTHKKNTKAKPYDTSEDDKPMPV